MDFRWNPDAELLVVTGTYTPIRVATSKSRRHTGMTVEDPGQVRQI